MVSFIYIYICVCIYFIYRYIHQIYIIFLTLYITDISFLILLLFCCPNEIECFRASRASCFMWSRVSHAPYPTCSRALRISRASVTTCPTYLHHASHISFLLSRTSCFSSTDYSLSLGYVTRTEGTFMTVAFCISDIRLEDL